MIITTPAPDADDGAAAMYEEDLDADGFVHSYTAAMAVRKRARVDMGPRGKRVQRGVSPARVMRCIRRRKPW